MKNIFYTGATALILLSAVACNENRKAKNFNEKTNADAMGIAFLKSVNEANLAEITAATAAQSKASNPRVVNFAKMMIAEHTQAQQELKKILEEKSVSVMDTVSQEHKMMLDSASKLPGAAFDKAYMQMMVKDHAKVAQIFYDATQNKDETVHNYAEKYLPKIKMHLDSAKAISSSLK